VTGQVIRRAQQVATALVLLTLAVQASAQPPPHVRLVATGGTIADRGDSRLTYDELLDSVPDLSAYARTSGEQFSNMSSGSLTLEQWLQLARRLIEILDDDPELAGIVISSGTDSLEELAYFLHLTVRDVRPVVLVGAMRPPGTPDEDGPDNLLAGFRVAAHPESRGRGALVVLDGAIHGAREVTKADTDRLDAFRSPPDGPIGRVGVDGVEFRAPISAALASWSEFDVSAVDKLPRVDVILSYQDAPGDLMRAAVDLGAQGLVIAALGAGATSGTQASAAQYAAERSVVVVRSTRTGAGRVRQRPEALAAGDLQPVKARVLLMLALTRTTEHDEIQALFDRH
jgi:L-asparaginase